MHANVDPIIKGGVIIEKTDFVTQSEIISRANVASFDIRYRKTHGTQLYSELSGARGDEKRRNLDHRACLIWTTLDPEVTSNRYS